MLEVNLWLWISFLVLIFICLFIDLGVFNRKKHLITIKEALTWTIVWFSLAMIFNGFIWYKFGLEQSIVYFTCYIIEKALSLDNLFVMLLLFSSFNIKPENQHRILFWGIIGALIMRGIFIFVGAAFVSRFHWLLYVFGVFLIYSGLKGFFEKKEKIDPHDKWLIKLLKKILPISKGSQDKFFIKENGKTMITMGFLTLIVIEFTDIIFAVDSIPAIFGITTEPFLIFTSNIFAILGLRSLYFVILHSHNSFKYFKESVSGVLVFIGAKMVLDRFIEIPILVSLGIIIGILVGGVLLSLYAKQKTEKLELKDRVTKQTAILK